MCFIFNETYKDLYSRGNCNANADAEPMSLELCQCGFNCIRSSWTSNLEKFVKIFAGAIIDGNFFTFFRVEKSFQSEILLSMQNEFCHQICWFFQIYLVVCSSVIEKSTHILFNKIRLKYRSAYIAVEAVSLSFTVSSDFSCWGIPD